MNQLDKVVTGAGGIALRYGIFYSDPDDGLVEVVGARKFPIVADAAGTWSFIPASGCRSRRGSSGQAAPAFPAPAHQAVRGRGAGRDGDRVPRRVEREGQARARLDAELSELANGLQGDVRAGRAGGAARRASSPATRAALSGRLSACRALADRRG
jgi:hypothetical protein